MWLYMWLPERSGWGWVVLPAVPTLVSPAAQRKTRAPPYTGREGPHSTGDPGPGNPSFPSWVPVAEEETDFHIFKRVWMLTTAPVPRLESKGLGHLAHPGPCLLLGI